MIKRPYMSLVFSNLVVFRSLSSNRDRRNLYTKFVKIIERYKQFSENLSTNMPRFLAVVRLYSRLLGRLGRFDVFGSSAVLGSLSLSSLQCHYVFSAIGQSCPPINPKNAMLSSSINRVCPYKCRLF